MDGGADRQAHESFRSLLLRHRGRTGLIQRDLAARAGIGLRSLQDWESGVTLPTAERLRALVRVLFETGGLTGGREAHEARELWAAAQREASRMRTPFDEEWFAELVSPREAAAGALVSEAVQSTEHRTESAERRQEWGEAPDTSEFVGRSDELTQLRQWVLEDRCRLVALVGIGGIGKTSLAARLARDLAPSFENVFWRGLRDAPPFSEWLDGAIGFLSNQRLVPPSSESDRITTLLQLLRAKRCLLVLDNSETLFEPGLPDVRYRTGLEGYGRLLQAIGESSHQSCLLLTSRETPPELTVLGGAVRSLEVRGLGTAEAQRLLAQKQLTGDATAWSSLVQRYGGNGLALKIVAETIRQVYDGDLAAFLIDSIARFGTVFGGIRRLLDIQVERLSSSERDVLIRLAIEREPISVADLSSHLGDKVGRSAAVEAMEMLRRRSLVERGERGATFTLQSMVLEYMTDRLVETFAEEIGQGKPVMLLEQPLIKAQAKDYVRQTQERLIGTPILQRLKARYADAGTDARLLTLLDAWRGRPPEEQGYGPGNVVNLLRLLRGHLRGLDLSRLVLRQAYLAGIEAQDASLERAHLAEAVLAEAVNFPTCAALSADATSLIAGTAAGEVWLWRVADRTPLLAIVGHTGPVYGVALSRDGRLLASSGEDGVVRLWEAATGRELATLRGHAGGVRVISLSWDGRLLASGGLDGTVRLWDVVTGQQLATVPGHSGAVWGIGLSADGRHLASGGWDGTVHMSQTASGGSASPLEGHVGAMWSMALSSDGQVLATGNADGVVTLWRLPRSQPTSALQAHNGPVYGVALSEDGALLASSGFDGTVRLWENPGGRPLATIQSHTSAVWGVALSADGQLLVSGSEEGTIRLWEVPAGRLLGTVPGHTSGIRGVALSADGGLVASGGLDGTVRLWEPSSGRLLSTLRSHSGRVWGVSMSSDGAVLGTAGEDGTVRLWEAGTGQPLATLRSHTGRVRCVALSGDGRLVASGGEDATVQLCDVASGRRVAALPGHASGIRGVAFDRDGRHLASCGLDGTVRLWEAASGRPLATLTDHAGTVWAVGISPDGQLLASGDSDGIVRLWEVPDGRPVTILQGHAGPVYGLALAGNGRLLASAGFDQTVRLWDVTTGRLLATLTGHAGSVWGVAFSPDGRLLASGGLDGTVRLWDAGRRTFVRSLRTDRRYERLDITGLTGITGAQHAALLALGGIERQDAPT